jgi:hypothetical protein
MKTVTIPSGNITIEGNTMCNKQLMLAELTQLEDIYTLNSAIDQLFTLGTVLSNLTDIKSTLETYGVTDGVVALIGTEISQITTGVPSKNVELMIEDVGETLVKVGKRVVDIVVYIFKKIDELLKNFFKLFNSLTKKHQIEWQRVSAARNLKYVNAELIIIDFSKVNMVRWTALHTEIGEVCGNIASQLVNNNLTLTDADHTKLSASIEEFNRFCNDNMSTFTCGSVPANELYKQMRRAISATTKIDVNKKLKSIETIVNKNINTVSSRNGAVSPQKAAELVSRGITQLIRGTTKIVRMEYTAMLNLVERKD